MNDIKDNIILLDAMIFLAMIYSANVIGKYLLFKRITALSCVCPKHKLIFATPVHIAGTNYVHVVIHQIIWHEHLIETQEPACSYFAYFRWVFNKDGRAVLNGGTLLHSSIVQGVSICFTFKPMLSQMGFRRTYCHWLYVSIPITTRKYYHPLHISCGFLDLQIPPSIANVVICAVCYVCWESVKRDQCRPQTSGDERSLFPTVTLNQG